MRLASSQKKFWKNEHKSKSNIPSLYKTNPSGSVKWFYNFLEKKGCTQGDLLDLGCGKGRNSFYLAGKGFNVLGVDYIRSAIDYCNQASIHKNFLYMDMKKPFPFENNSFDLIVDCFSSIDIESKEGRLNYRKESFRCLKNGGLLFVSAVSIHDELESQFYKLSPGPEHNSVIWPGNGKFQKNYSENEFKKFYDIFELTQFKTKREKSFKLGKKFNATLYWAIMKKRKERGK